MAGAKKQPRRKKRAPNAASPTSTPIAPVSRSASPSSSPSTRELAARLGIHPSTLRRRVIAGTVRAVVDAQGRYHYPPTAASRPSNHATQRPPFRKKKAKGVSREPSRAAKKKRASRAQPGVTSAPTRAPSRARPAKKPPFRKKRPTTRAPAPLRAGVRVVRESASPTLAEAAESFGVRPSKLLDWVIRGRVRALADASGTLRIPAAELQAKQLALKRARKKRESEGRGPRAPWETTDGAARRKKKRPSVEGKKKKKAGKLVPAKKKRVRKTKPSRQRFTEAIADDTRPSRFAEERPTPAVVSRDAPMQLELAAQRVGNAMRDFVMAKPRWERLATGRVFHDLKTSFKSTYSERQWRLTYAWVVDEWGLEDYIFDYEALRDS